MSRKSCYWPDHSDQAWHLLNYDPSDEDLNNGYIEPEPLSCGCYQRSWRYQSPRKSGFSTIQKKKDGFKVSLDLSLFDAENVRLTVDGNYVVVEAEHEEREDDFGYISRNLKRRYLLPDNVDADRVGAELSSDGVLTITAPRKGGQRPEGAERVIPIVQSGKPASTEKKGQEDRKLVAGTSQGGEGRSCHCANKDQTSGPGSSQRGESTHSEARSGGSASEVQNSVPATSQRDVATVGEAPGGGSAGNDQNLVAGTSQGGDATEGEGENCVCPSKNQTSVPGTSRRDEATNSEAQRRGTAPL